MNHGKGRSGVLYYQPVLVGALVASIAALSTGALPAAAAAGPVAAASPVHAASGLSTVETWSTGNLPDAGSPIALSSPAVADLPGGPAAVIGDRAGYLYAFNLATGAREWTVNEGGIGIDGSPSAAKLGGAYDTVFDGIGDSIAPTRGYYQAINPNGTVRWEQTAYNPSTDTGIPMNGVSTGMAVGTLQGQTAVVSGSMGQNEAAYNASSGAELPGFPWLESDSNFSTPGIADIEGNGTNQIVEGGDATRNPAFPASYYNMDGGHIRILNQTAALGQPYGTNPPGGLYCEYNTNQVVASSPAVGQFLAGGAVGAVSGTGTEVPGASQTDVVLAIDKHCGLQWQTTLDGGTTSSPALADVEGNGALQVIEGTNRGPNGGSVYALNGTNGAVIWRHDNGSGAPVIGSVVTVDLGGGYQDVLDPTPQGLVILDGRTGNQILQVESGVQLQDAPLVTDDPNGTIGITVAGYSGSNAGVVEHFEVLGSNGSHVTEAGSWPEFHHDAQLSGNAGTPPPTIEVACNKPAQAAGYLETASDGGIFTFGDLPFCGSTGNIVLNKPIVGMAETRDGGGYWLVASDGGIFAFGDAKFYGSAGGIRLNQPIVGMAATPDGRGYWLVASDGGIFAYGDAKFYGSAGGIRLNQPIVGIAADPKTGGYWMVARDGGIFAYNAPFLGSMGGSHLNQPIVGIAADPKTGGYWMVASDGGIFTFDAPFLGSMGGSHLNQPIVGMAS